MGRHYMSIVPACIGKNVRRSDAAKFTGPRALSYDTGAEAKEPVAQL